MLNRRNHVWIAAVSGLTGMLLLTSAASVYAGSTGRRNTAVALSGATLYELGKGHDSTALLFGLGSAYAWKQYEEARKAEKQEKQQTTPVTTGGSTSPYSYAPRNSASSGARYVPTTSVHHAAVRHAAVPVHSASAAAALSAARQAALMEQNAALQARVAALEQQTQAFQHTAKETAALQTDNATLRDEIAQQQTALQQLQTSKRWWQTGILGLVTMGLIGLAATLWRRRHPSGFRPAAQRSSLSHA